MKYFILILALVISTPNPAQAGFYGSGAILGKCAELDLQCQGFIGGVHDTIRLLQQAEIVPMTYCPPKGILMGDVVAIVQAYAVKNPGVKNYESAGIVSAALHDAFRCEAVK